MSSAAGAIAGIVVASLVAVIFIALSIGLVILLILVKKERKVQPDLTFFEGVKVVLGVSIYILYSCYHLISGTMILPSQQLVVGWDDTDYDDNITFEVVLHCVTH